MCALPTPIPERPSARPSTPGAPLTPILGRDAEVRDVLALLDRDDLRVVTLLGPGGVGKTRLAREVDALIAPHFAHGAQFIPLASIRDPALVPNAVAQALGFEESGDRTAVELLRELLADRHMLLVLDNLEQVIGAAHPWLSDLIGHATRLRFLVTSRIPLNIAGEQQYTVPTLPTTADQGKESAAVMLFAQRAHAVNHAFTLEDQTVVVIAEICRELDGLPLAIELAAARMKLLSPEALLRRLTSRLKLLAGGHLDVPPRLRSLRDAIRWSYELLSDDEQALFRRLAVFLGGFTLEAAEFVAAWPDPPGAGERGAVLLQSLVDQSLVQPTPEASGARFRMLETIREFGLAAVEECADPEAAPRAHAAYALDLAARSERPLMGPEQAAWLELLEGEYANIRAAVTWLETHDRIADAIALNARIMFFLNLRGHAVETLERMDPWLRHPDLQPASRSRGLMLLIVGSLLQNVGESDRSATMLTEAAGMLRDAGDRWYAAFAFNSLGWAYWFAYQLEAMVQAAEMSIELAERLGQHRTVSNGLCFLAKHAQATGQVVRATALMEQSYEEALRGEDRWMTLLHLQDRSLAALLNGDSDGAERLAQEGRAVAESLGSKRDLPWTWGILAMISRERGDYEAAADRVASGLAVAQACGHRSLATELIYVGALVDIARGEFARAAKALAGILAIRDRPPARFDVVRYLDAYAELARRTNDAPRAARFLGAFTALAEPTATILTDIEPTAGCFRHRDELRATLGAAEFERQFDAGAALGMAIVAEALAYAPSVMQPGTRAAPSPGFDLTFRELEVLQHMANGLSNQQIADAMFLSQRTITTHVTGILAKLSVPSRTAAVSYAIRQGLA